MLEEKKYVHTSGYIKILTKENYYKKLSNTNMGHCAVFRDKQIISHDILKQNSIYLMRYL